MHIRPWRRIAASAGASIVILIVVLMVRTTGLDRPEEPVADRSRVAIDSDGAADRLARMVGLRTISYQDAHPDTAAFVALHALLAESYPRVHASLTRDVVADLSLLYTWNGADATLSPLVLCAHLDVVPAQSPERWTHDPFAGVIEDGFVHGRGTTDDKSSVAGILEAVESLLAAGHVPGRTVFLAFGHDEEIGGRDGAAAIARTLRDRGVHDAIVIDEGGAVTIDAVPGVDRPVAVVGVSEKGSADVVITAMGTGGHSSVPRRPTAIGVLASAVTRLEARPMPARLDGPTLGLLESATPHMSFLMRTVFANRWLFGTVIERVMASNPATDATIRTTTAPTIVSGGVKSNVLPDEAMVHVNFRLLPGDSAEQVAEHVRQMTRDLPVTVRLLDGATEASPVSRWIDPAYDALARSIRQVFADRSPIVAPYLVVGGTDGRHYATVSERVYRFQPIVVAPAGGMPFHSTDERLSTTEFARMALFYATVVESMDSIGG